MTEDEDLPDPAKLKWENHLIVGATAWSRMSREQQDAHLLRGAQIKAQQRLLAIFRGDQ